MITLPPVAFVILLAFTFFIGVGVGAILKDPADNNEKKDIFPNKPVKNPLPLSEYHLNNPQQLDENKMLRVTSIRKLPISKEFKLDESNNELIRDIKLLDQKNRMPLIQDRIEWITLRDEFKKRYEDKDE